jgi:hypothetical protein
MSPTIAVEQNADGCLEVFSIGPSGTLNHKWQTTPNGSWSSWASLGGEIFFNRFTVARNADGRLEAFAKNVNGVLTHTGQTAPGSTSWTAWTSMGPSTGTATGGVPFELTVVENADGRLEVFAYGHTGGGMDWGLIHVWQIAPSNGWSGLASLGGNIGEGRFTVGRNADDRLEAFAYGIAPNAPGPGLIHVWQIAPGSNSWSDWTPLGGALQEQPGVGVGRNADGRLEVFAVRTDGEIVHKVQTAPSNGWLWGWASLGGEIRDTFYSTPVIGHNTDGRLEVFVLDREGTLHHKWQTTPNGSWAVDWATEYLPEPLTGVAVGRNADGRLEVFAQRGGLGKRFRKSQTAPGSNSWSDWVVFD